MDLKVKYTQVSDEAEAYKLGKNLITSESIAKWNVTADVQYQDEAHNILAKGKGFTLTLKFKQDYAQVDCELSLMLKPFRKSIMSAVEDKLKQHL